MQLSLVIVSDNTIVVNLLMSEEEVLTLVKFVVEDLQFEEAQRRSHIMVADGIYLVGKRIGCDSHC